MTNEVTRRHLFLAPHHAKYSRPPYNSPVRVAPFCVGDLPTWISIAVSSAAFPFPSLDHFSSSPNKYLHPSLPLLLLVIRICSLWLLQGMKVRCILFYAFWIPSSCPDDGSLIFIGFRHRILGASRRSSDVVKRNHPLYSCRMILMELFIFSLLLREKSFHLYLRH